MTTGEPEGNDQEQGAARPPADSPFVAERVLREVARWVAERGPSTVQELEAEVEAFMAEGYEERRRRHLAEDRRERSQDLAFEALEAGEPERAWALAEEAVALDPQCVDALAVLAFRDAEDQEGLIDQLRDVLALAESQAHGHPGAARGPAAEPAGAGAGPWALVAARPRMRVMKQLAEALWDAGRRLDAVALYERLLELDPEDRQGNDRLLLACYLAMRELGRSREVLERRLAEPEAFYAWARVLERFLAAGPEEAAGALAAAKLLNPHVEALLARREPLPEEAPVAFEPGEPSEAVVCAWILGPAWAEQPEALWWLMQGGGDGPPPGGPRAKSLH